VTLKDVINHGHLVKSGRSLSTGSGKTFKEILNYSLKVTAPRERLVWNPSRRLNLEGAVARFVWMLGGNDRLRDIEFYWGQNVSPFSDDGILLSGSDTGHRILYPLPGVNQLKGAIDRLVEDSSTRRAAITIYQPIDAVRKSVDIPCALGLAFHIRNHVLHASTFMRSNNALRLLPYNLFEFSLLAEVVAAVLKVGLGTLCYSALSMHVFQEDFEEATRISEQTKSFAKLSMPRVPSSPDPMEQIKELVKLEAEARYSASGLTERRMDQLISLGRQRLSPYWRQFLLLLLMAITKDPASNFAQRLRRELADPWRRYFLA